MRKLISFMVAVLALSLALGGCIGQDWFSSRPTPAQLLERAREVGRGVAPLAELRGLALQVGGTGIEIKGPGNLCPFDTDGDDKLSDEEMLEIIAAWIRGELTDEEVLTAVALWIKDASLGCYGYELFVDEPEDARDVAISYVNSHYETEIYPPWPDSWFEECVNPEFLCFWYRYTLPDWKVDVLQAGWFIWDVTIRGPLFEWDGRVYYDGNVEEFGWADARPPSVVEFDRLAARDLAIEYISKHEPSSGIPQDADWREEDVTPPEVVGSALYRYTAAGFGGWRIWVSYPIVPLPDYRVEVANFVTGFYWQGSVHPTGVVRTIPYLIIHGIVIVKARGSRSESWGIRVTGGPPEYLEKEVGLKSFTEMKPELEELEGELISVRVYKVCRSFTEGCCASVFELCAPYILSWW